MTSTMFREATVATEDRAAKRQLSAVRPLVIAISCVVVGSFAGAGSALAQPLTKGSASEAGNTIVSEGTEGGRIGMVPAYVATPSSEAGASGAVAEIGVSTAYVARKRCVRPRGAAKSARLQGSTSRHSPLALRHLRALRCVSSVNIARSTS